jgi:hypothetical protein
MRKTFRLAVLIFLALACLPALFAQEFSWKMEVARLSPGGQDESLPFHRVIRIADDETIELRLVAQSDCYSYVLIRSSGGGIKILNGVPLKGSAQRAWRVKIESPPGSETIYVLMSSSRQDGLEAAIRDYKERADGKNAEAVYHEVLKIQAEGIRGKERPPEISLSGAAIRGEFEVEYYGSDRYVKTVTLRHGR